MRNLLTLHTLKSLLRREGATVKDTRINSLPKLVNFFLVSAWTTLRRKSYQSITLNLQILSTEREHSGSFGRLSQYQIL